MIDLRWGLDVVPVPPRFEDGFMILLRAHTEREPLQAISSTHPLAAQSGEAVVQVQQLLKKFGAFTAVDRISFEVRRGEIFGLLGPNGAGKTTTFRMLCGLLTPSAGQLRVAGADVRNAPASARARLGYVAQKFSLYGPLSVLENLNSSPAPMACAANAARAHRLGDAAVRSGRATARHELAAAGRLQAAPGDGRRAAARAGDSVSR